MLDHHHARPYHTIPYVTRPPYSYCSYQYHPSRPRALSLFSSLPLPLPHYSLSLSLLLLFTHHSLSPHTNSLPYKVLLHIRFGEFPNKHSLIVATAPFFFLFLYSLLLLAWFTIIMTCFGPFASAFFPMAARSVDRVWGTQNHHHCFPTASNFFHG